MSLNRTEKGHLIALAKGFCPWSIPFGYERQLLYTPDEIRYRKIKNPVILDEVKAIIIKDIFEMYATGRYSQRDIEKELHLKYSNLDKSNLPGINIIGKILLNKFYAGFIVHKGKEYPHNYPTVITLELFEQARAAAISIKIIKKTNQPINFIRKKKETKKYIKSLEKPISPSALKRLMSGHWVAVHPFGYKTKLPEKRRKFGNPGTVYVDEIEAAVVKDIFNEYSKGGISLKAVDRFIKEKYPDVKICKNTAHRVLNSKFYIGIMEYKGKEYPHVYPTLVSKEIFDLCRVISDNNTKYSTWIPTITIETRETLELSPLDKRIYDCLSSPLDIEDLMIQVDISPSEMKQALISLLERNIISKNEYNEYQRNVNE